VVGSIVVVVVVSIVVVDVQGISVVVPSVPMVVVSIVVPVVVPAVAVVVPMVVPMVVSGMGGHGHSEKEGELGPLMQSGHSATKSQLASK